MEKPVKDQGVRAGWLVSSPYNVYAWFPIKSEAEKYAKELNEKGVEVLPSRMVYEQVWDHGQHTEFDGCIHNWTTVGTLKNPFGTTKVEQCDHCMKIRMVPV